MKIFLSAINIFIGIRNCSIQITGVEIQQEFEEEMTMSQFDNQLKNLYGLCFCYGQVYLRQQLILYQRKVNNITTKSLYC
ncbi:MAG TPA: hypothetical protein DHM90_10065 [Clostridiaceae bacterium]|nr:hypothetical protein [Clostridiaceae bacterium]